MDTQINPNNKLPIFDVQVDGNHLEGKTQICAYPVVLDHLGFMSTDTFESFISITVPSLGFEDDVWYDTLHTIPDYWPVHIRKAYAYVVDTATDLYFQTHEGDPRGK